MKLQRHTLIAVTVAALLGAAFVAFGVRAADDKKPAAAPKPALTVTVTQPQSASQIGRAHV